MIGKNVSESARETTKWLKGLNWKKILLVGLIYTIFTSVIRQFEVVITLKYYLMSDYFDVWSKFMMPTAGPPPREFMITSLLSTFYTGVSLSVVYYYVRHLLPKLFWSRVFYFADLMIAASFIFFTLPCYLLFNLPWQLLLSWFVSGFLILVLASLTMVKIID